MTPVERMNTLEGPVVYNMEIEDPKTGIIFEFSEDVPNGGVHKYTEKTKEGEILTAYYKESGSKDWLTTPEFIHQLASEAGPEVPWDSGLLVSD